MMEKSKRGNGSTLMYVPPNHFFCDISFFFFLGPT